MLFWFKIFKIFINTTSEFTELIVMIGSGSSSTLQSGISESKSDNDEEVFVRLILIVFS